MAVEKNATAEFVTMLSGCYPEWGIKRHVMIQWVEEIAQEKDVAPGKVVRAIGRFLRFDPHSAWTLERKDNPAGYLSVISRDLVDDYLQESRDTADAAGVDHDSFDLYDHLVWQEEQARAEAECAEREAEAAKLRAEQDRLAAEAKKAAKRQEEKDRAERERAELKALAERVMSLQRRLAVCAEQDDYTQDLVYKDLSFSHGPRLQSYAAAMEEVIERDRKRLAEAGLPEPSVPDTLPDKDQYTVQKDGSVLLSQRGDSGRKVWLTKDEAAEWERVAAARIRLWLAMTTTEFTARFTEPGDGVFDSTVRANRYIRDEFLGGVKINDCTDTEALSRAAEHIKGSVPPPPTEKPVRVNNRGTSCDEGGLGWLKGCSRRADWSFKHHDWCDEHLPPDVREKIATAP